MMGASYVGATQMLAAISTPPHLAGIAPNVTASNYHDGWTYQSGAFEQWFDQNWTTQLARNTLDRLIDLNTDARVGAPTLSLANYPVFNFGQLPAEAQLTAAIAPYYEDWLAHPDYDDYWKQWSIEENFSKIAVPTLQVGGWYDIFSIGTLRNYIGVKHTEPPKLRAISSTSSCRLAGMQVSAGGSVMSTSDRTRWRIPTRT
jgi:putative CocE/NonD family hydrolase